MDVAMSNNAGVQEHMCNITRVSLMKLSYIPSTRQDSYAQSMESTGDPDLNCSQLWSP